MPIVDFLFDLFIGNFEGEFQESPFFALSGITFFPSMLLYFNTVIFSFFYPVSTIKKLKDNIRRNHPNDGGWETIMSRPFFFYHAYGILLIGSFTFISMIPFLRRREEKKYEEKKSFYFVDTDTNPIIRFLNAINSFLVFILGGTFIISGAIHLGIEGVKWVFY